MTAEAEGRLREVQERLGHGQSTDSVTWQLRALGRDIAAAQAELDAFIASAQERARRLDELHERAGPAPA